MLSKKQYTWWLRNYLGRGVRKVIPSCTLWAIPEAYPSIKNNYIPFKESKDGQERTDN